MRHLLDPGRAVSLFPHVFGDWRVVALGHGAFDLQYSRIDALGRRWRSAPDGEELGAEIARLVSERDAMLELLGRISSMVGCTLCSDLLPCPSHAPEGCAPVLEEARRLSGTRGA